MSHWKENENLQSIERLSENEVMEMLRQLKLGREEAEKEFHESLGDTRSAADGAVAKIEKLAEGAGEELVEVRKELGQLNALLGVEKIDDAETVDTFRERILHQMSATLKALRNIEGVSREQLQSSGDNLESVWRTFLRRIELVRAHLASTREGAAEAFEKERQRIAAGLGESRHQQSTAGDYKHADGGAIADPDMFSDWLKGFFQHPDVAVPDSPGK